MFSHRHHLIRITKENRLIFVIEAPKAPEPQPEGELDELASIKAATDGATAREKESEKDVKRVQKEVDDVKKNIPDSKNVPDDASAKINKPADKPATKEIKTKGDQLEHAMEQAFEEFNKASEEGNFLKAFGAIMKLLGAASQFVKHAFDGTLDNPLPDKKDGKGPATPGKPGGPEQPPEQRALAALQRALDTTKTALGSRQDQPAFKALSTLLKGGTAQITEKKPQINFRAASLNAAKDTQGAAISIEENGIKVGDILFTAKKEANGNMTMEFGDAMKLFEEIAEKLGITPPPKPREGERPFDLSPPGLQPVVPIAME